MCIYVDVLCVLFAQFLCNVLYVCSASCVVCVCVVCVLVHNFVGSVLCVCV